MCLCHGLCLLLVCTASGGAHQHGAALCSPSNANNIQSGLQGPGLCSGFGAVSGRDKREAEGEGEEVRGRREKKTEETKRDSRGAERGGLGLRLPSERI